MPAGRRRDLDRRLVSRDLDERRVLGDLLALLDEPAGDLALGQSLAEIRQLELVRHGRRSLATGREARTLAERLDLVFWRLLASHEHRHLEAWAVDGVAIHQLARDRLHDEMDVAGDTARVRPEADVNLLRLQEPGDDRRGLLEQRAELRRLLRREIGDMEDVGEAA